MSKINDMIRNVSIKQDKLNQLKIMLVTDYADSLGFELMKSLHQQIELRLDEIISELCLEVEKFRNENK